jgi:hypothetical protein
MPVRNDVNAADTMMLPTRARFSGRALRHIAIAAAGSPPHLEQVRAAQDTRGRIAGEKPRDIAGHNLPRSIDERADLKKERDVPDVMQAEWQEQAFDDTVRHNRDTRVAVRGIAREHIDRSLDRRPHQAQHDAEADGRKRRDDRDEPLAGEEPEVRRQLDPVVPIEQRAGGAADEDAAEHARVHRIDAHDRLRRQTEVRGHDAERRQEHDEADGSGQRRDAVVVGQSQRHADREDERQRAEDGAARLRHHIRQRRWQTREVRAADTEQQSGHRQHRDREHQRLADLLEDCETAGRIHQ